MAPCSMILTAAPSDGNLFQQLLPWLIVLLITIVVGGVIMYLARRVAHGSDRKHNVGFTLHDLRQLHAQGELTDEQFERARARMIASVRAATDNTESSGQQGDTGNKPGASSVDQSEPSTPDTPDDAPRPNDGP